MKKVEPKSLSSSNRKIYDAAELASERVNQIVAGVSESHRNARVEKWVDFIRDSVRVIWFRVPDRDHAFRIFETLNDRGLDLTVSDLLKNYLFECVKNEHEEIHEHWTKMQGALAAVTKKDLSVAYIRHLWISQNGPTRERQLYDAIKKSITGQQQAIDFAHTLSETASSYAAMLSSDHDFWTGYGTEAKRDVSSLVTFKMERIRPLLLAIMQVYKKHEIQKSLRLLVAWSVRLMIAGGPAGTLEKEMGELALKVTKKDLTTAHDLTQADVTSIAKDNDFKAAFAVASVSQKYLGRYYIRVLENYDKDKTDPSALAVDEREEKCDLEHIQPLKPGPEWGFDTEKKKKEADEWVNRIGNLTLMTKGNNGAAANAGFSVKLPFYKREKGLNLTHGLAEYKTWGPTEISERQKYLAELAVKAWPIRMKQ